MLSADQVESDALIIGSNAMAWPVCSGNGDREKRMNSKKGWEVILTEVGN